MAQIIGFSFESALKVGLKPRDQNGRELPIVADLTTTDEPAWVFSVGASNIGTKGDERAARRDLKGNRGNVGVGFNIAEASPDIAANYQPVQL